MRRTLELLLISLLLPLLALTSSARAGSATWKTDPTTDDWNTAANWTQETVPDESADVATFDASSTTSISVMSEFLLGSIVFNPGAGAYTIAINENDPAGFIGFFGAGVINNSGVIQNINGFGGVGFGGTATAGNNVVYTNQDVGNPLSFTIGFVDHSNAGSATFINVGDVTGNYGGSITFNNSSSAANSTIINQTGTGHGGGTGFRDSSTAANSTITSYHNAGVNFADSSTAGNATLIADGGVITFEYESTGGTARVELLHGGELDLSNIDKHGPTGLGSLEGDSTSSVLLGHEALIIGGNGLSTTFAGTLIAGHGALTKVGNETLTLTGNNSYNGGTVVNSGTLIAAALIGSATGNGSVQVNRGTFGGTGNVSGAVTIGNGTSGKATLAPGVKGPGTLTIAKSLTFKSNGNYNFELGLTPHPKADQVAANGVTIASGAEFNLRRKGTQTLASGTTFTAISNTSANPISGTFSNLADGSTIIAGNNTLRVSYSGGDGNDLTLTVQ